MKKTNKIITSVVAFAFCFSVVAPAAAGYQTIYVPDNYNMTGQTYIYQNTTSQPIVVQQPTQTIVVQEQKPSQTVIVRDTQTNYSDDALWVAGIGTLVGGVILGSLIGHDHKTTHYKAPPAPHHNVGKPKMKDRPKGGKPHGGKR